MVRQVANRGSGMEILENSSGIDGSWSEFYGKLKDINGLYEMIEKSSADPARHVNQTAMLTIYKIYHAFRTLDKFGDMPYSEAGKGYTELLFRPVYDTQQTVYVALLDELKGVVKSMVLDDETAAGESMFDFDINARLWRGDHNAIAHFTKWKQFGNSLLLKHALRMSKADASKAKEYISAAMQGPLMSGIEDGAAMIPTSIDGYNNGSRKNAWQWTRFYSPGTRPAQFMSSLMTTAADPGVVDSADVVDPRFFGVYWPNDQGEYRIVPNSPDDVAQLDMIVSDAKNYPGGEWAKTLKWWDDAGYEANYCVFNRFYATSMFMPQQMLTYSEHCLIMAEIIEMGLASGNAKMYYEAGVRASISEFLNPAFGNYPDNNPGWIVDVTEADLDAIVAHPKVSFDAAADKLKAIRTQRWIDYFHRPDNTWAMVRRTNVFDFDNTVPLFEEGSKINMIYRLKYPGSEIEYNTDNYLETLGRMGGQDDIRHKNWLWK